MNILIINQSVIDLCASFFTLLLAVVEVDGTRLSRDSIHDQFVCRIWLTRAPLWALSVTSTYGILITAFERYFAVIHPICYNVKPFFFQPGFLGTQVFRTRLLSVPPLVNEKTSIAWEITRDHALHFSSIARVHELQRACNEIVFTQKFKLTGIMKRTTSVVYYNVTKLWYLGCKIRVKVSTQCNSAVHLLWQHTYSWLWSDQRNSAANKPRFVSLRPTR